MRFRIFCFALCAALSVAARAAIPASEQTVAVEFYHAQFDHYFITAEPNEIKDLDTGVHKGWTRTGYRFAIMKAGSSYAGTSPVCRFYSPTKDTHFYSAKKSECDDVKTKPEFTKDWTFESDEVFRAFVVDPATGVCGTDTTATYRLWNNRVDSNHRYTDQIGVFVYMKSKSYIPEGDGSPALPVVFCTPSGGDVVPAATESAPSCTVTATTSTPALGSTLTLTATCTNSPTAFMWQGCTSATNICTSTRTTAGSVTYTLYAANAAGPSDPVPMNITWGGSGQGGGPVPICSMSANTIAPNVGQTVTLTASCNNSPATYNWVECNYLVQTICNPIPTCSTTAPTCNVSATAAGYTRHGVNGKNAAGSGPAIYLDMYWTGSGNPPPSGGGGGIPVCSITPSNTTPEVGSTITLSASCTYNPSSYDWIGPLGVIPECASSSSCQVTWAVAQSVTYGVSGINGVGTGGRAYTGVNWKQTLPQPPACTLSASSSTPSVGQVVTITASCTNSPTSYTWKAGCTSTTSSCTDSATAAGAKVYTMSATNAVGNSPDASITVNWQPLPTAVPSCTLTSSDLSPFTGSNITLTATCTNSPASYTWSGCSSTTNTCTTTASSAGNVTYGVIATNVLGPSTQATVSVNWQQSTGGQNFCGANTSYVDITWGAAGPRNGRWLTSDYGGFPQGKVFVFSITVPVGTPHSVYGQTFAPAEYQGPPAPRSMTLSENACDFGPTVLDAQGGTAPLTTFNVGGPPGVSLTPGKTYYFNLRNDNCGQSSCDMSVSIPWR